jgi:DnaJ-class molecular chaperone
VVEYKDYYKILGVSKTATDKEIKAAFRKLARKYHPDVNKGDAKAEAKFKEINEANEVLSDPDKRRRYDQLGPDWASFGGGRAAGPRPGPGGVRVEYGGEDMGGFSEFFRTIFGGGFGGAGGGGGFGGPFGGGPQTGGFEDMFGRQAPPQGQDLETTAELTLEELMRGTTRSIQIGEGGEGRRIEVKIPPGMREGSRMRVPNEGGGRAGGPRGHLYLAIKVAPHPTFEKRGDDLAVNVQVPLTTMVLGGETTVPTLDGPVGIKIPAGSRAGRVFRLRAHGLPRREGGRGDLLATVNVDLPGPDLNERERKLFEELRAAGR